MVGFEELSRIYTLFFYKCICWIFIKTFSKNADEKKIYSVADFPFWVIPYESQSRWSISVLFLWRHLNSLFDTIIIFHNAKKLRLLQRMQSLFSPYPEKYRTCWQQHLGNNGAWVKRPVIISSVWWNKCPYVITVITNIRTLISFT